MKKVIFLFYNHYNQGFGRRFAYQSALWAVLTVGLINAFSLMLYVNFALLKTYSYLNRRSWEQNLIVICLSCLVLGYHVFWLLYKKEKIEALHYTTEDIKRSGRYLIVYIIVSIIVLLLVIKDHYAL
ncbi:hypothetical protein A0256_09230 [Mucilaginibacter sp. PAMC 26640]|nr:hypothetical protein A0256_09230 [Mucilaginibacter sp. PAMC 26640]